MSKTDKTDPYKIRHTCDPCQCPDTFRGCNCYGSHKRFCGVDMSTGNHYTNAERLVRGRRAIAFAKRAKAKRDRRDMSLPLVYSMSGKGYGLCRYRYAFAD